MKCEIVALKTTRVQRDKEIAMKMLNVWKVWYAEKDKPILAEASFSGRVRNVAIKVKVIRIKLTLFWRGLGPCICKVGKYLFFILPFF